MDPPNEQYCYLTTTGRRTGRPHTIEIWFAISDGVLYMLAGGRHGADWVRNLENDPAVSLRIADREFGARARVVSAAAEDALARHLLLEKYASSADDLANWGGTALPVAIDLRPDTI
jgi:deazaflavin-dependent oxidoreductase (nitroreductase family)